ncbi:Fanconi anemia group J protein homolog [Phymastichus coffea]|uniref:Fanconi anemia group J protein homolog n=1 Tax=Phymastichus coffea TaxID=108790 RepID=UPI00273CABC5|nr:Fanconi anemia group J protein homolog [Phymastichus coffea]
MGSMQVPKIYYGSRTHKQIEQVIREFKKTAYSDKPMTILSSREHTCIQNCPQGKSKTQLCNDLHDVTKNTTGRCNYNTDKSKYTMSHEVMYAQGLETPWDIEDLVLFGKEKNACPYFGARGLMPHSDIIFCPYNYLLDPIIRDTMQLTLKNDIVIIDEAHNIESICRDVSSADFREDNIGEAIEDCKYNFNQTNDSATYECIKQYLEDMAKLICDQILPTPENVNAEVTSECWTGDQTWSMFKINGLAEKRFQEFCLASSNAISIYNQMKEDQQTGVDRDKENTSANDMKKQKKKPAITFVTKRLLEELVMALNLIQNPTFCKDYRCTISQNFHWDAKHKVENNSWIPAQGGQRLRSLKFMCMNSAIIFGQMAKNTRCVILASGTLSPTSTFESELGTKFIHKLSANHVVPKEQVYVRGIPRGPKGTILKATYNNVQALPFKDDLGQLVLEVCQAVPHGVLCFFSSYTMMDNQTQRWKETGTWNEIERCKHIVTEPRRNNDLDEIMSEFREVIKDTSERPAACGITGALLFAVFRGKVAEGIDFSDNEARAVLTIGIPYAVQSDPNVKLKREYNDQNRNKGLLPGGEWYSVQAYRALNQALGRCIRHRNDWGAILLVDERLLTSYSASYLPKWIREMRQNGSNYNLKEELKAFVSRQQINDKERAAK